ncbi:MAG: penicillin-binding protein 2 [Bacteroidota bacterium]
MDENYFGSPIRKQIFFFIILGFFSLQVFQLVRMQLLNTDKYEEKSNENSIKTNIINPARGLLYDRNINLLVGNKASFILRVTPDHYRNSNTKKIETVLNADSGYVDQILQKNRKYSKYSPRNIMRNVTNEVISWVDENKDKLPGVDYNVQTQRDYSFGVTGSHAFGYTKEIDNKALSSLKDIYSMGDYIGASGIEKTYEKYLRGSKGKEYFVVNSRQKVVGKYKEGREDIPPQKGNDLILTIDKNTQIAAEEALTDYTGAVIALEPQTGEILAFVSAPEYDLSNFASVTSSDFWDTLSSDTTKPLFNRVTMSRNPPGSTFKMLIAFAGLEEKIISKNFSVNCKGGHRFGNRFFRCTHQHGYVNMTSAIERSCNTYFYQLILKLGIDNLYKYSKMFHFGEKTRIDIGQEFKGLIPSKEYYDKVYGEGRWTNGNLLSLGIGQGEILTTPLQLAQYAALLANFGKTKTPHLVRGYIESETNRYVPLEYDSIEVNISRTSFNVIRKGMYNVVQGVDGTAKWIKLKDIEISGKTGTAQNPHGEDHALFIAFAPFDNPKIAVAVIVENVGYGSTYAAPIARRVIKAYLQPEKEKLELFTSN